MGRPEAAHFVGSGRYWTKEQLSKHLQAANLALPSANLSANPCAIGTQLADTLASALAVDYPAAAAIAIETIARLRQVRATRGEVSHAS